LSIVYGEVVATGNPADPGQSRRPGEPGEEDAARHSLLFQTAYSGALSVYVSSQPMRLRIAAPSGRLSFFLFVLKSTADAPAITCLVSLSGYIEK